MSCALELQIIPEENVEYQKVWVVARNYYCALESLLQRFATCCKDIHNLKGCGMVTSGFGDPAFVKTGTGAGSYGSSRPINCAVSDDCQWHKLVGTVRKNRQNEGRDRVTHFIYGSYLNVSLGFRTEENNISKNLFREPVRSTPECEERLLWVCVPLATDCIRA